MKNLIISMIVVMVVTSCTPPPPPDTSAFDEGVAKFNANVEIADATFNLFENGDLDGMIANYADDLIWSPPNTSDSLSKEVWAEGMRGWHAEFENFKFRDRQYYPGVSEGDYIPDGGVRVYGVWDFTHKATGKVLSQKYYAVLKFNDEGKIVADLEWFDQGGIFDQIEE
jgi:ketosteroid isomerase-like protein